METIEQTHFRRKMIWISNMNPKAKKIKPNMKES